MYLGCYDLQPVFRQVFFVSEGQRRSKKFRRQQPEGAFFAVSVHCEACCWSRSVQ